MCERVVEDDPDALVFAPEHFKTKDMYERVAECDPYTLEFFADHLKT